MRQPQSQRRVGGQPVAVCAVRARVAALRRAVRAASFVGCGALVAALAGACARAEQVPATPAGVEAPRSADELEEGGDRDLGSLQRQLADAEASLDVQLHAARLRATAGGAQWATPPPATSTTATDDLSVRPPSQNVPGPDAGEAYGTPSAGHNAEQRKAAPVLDSASPCGAACRALGSMRRAADGICRIVGDEDDRCTQANARADAASERVRQAGCACGAG